MTPTTHSPIHPRLRTLLSRVIAGAATAVVVAVPPIALWALVGNPLPEDLPGWSGVQAALTEGQLAERTLFKVLALICWIAWFELIVALALELVGTFRADDRPPVPVLGVFRSLAVVLVAGLSLSSSSDAAGADDTDLPPLPRMPETPASVDPDEQRGPEPDQDERSATTPRVATRAGASPRTPEAHTHVVDDYMVDEEHVVDEYVVEQRDSLWAIADRELGDPHRWIEILELNREREQPGGGRLQDPGDLIHPGWVLTLPTHPTAGPSDESVVVRDGDTLWGIAETHLGTGARWPEIAAENTDRINDPDLILPDWNLDLPASTGAPEDRDPLAAARHADESAQAVDAEAEAALDRLREATKDRESAPGNGAGAPPDHHAPLTSLPPAEPVTPDPSHDAKPDPDAKAEPAADPESVSPVEVNDSETEAKSPEDTDADPLPVVPPAPSDEGPATDRTLRLPASETWPDRRGSDEDPEHERPEREEAEREEIELDTGDDLIDIASVEVRPTSLTRSLTGAGIFAAGVAWTLTRLRRARERRRESGDPVVACEHPGTEISIRQAAEAELMTFLELSPGSVRPSWA